MSLSRRRVRLPQGSIAATVEGMSHDGRGIARLDGKTVFVSGALPGEEIEFRYLKRRSRFDQATTTAVLRPSPDRAQPLCGHFGVCGGCALQHLKSDRQIQFKQQNLLDALQRIGGVAPESVLPPLKGPFWAYRRKARLAVKFVPGKGRVLVGFRERDAPFVADLRQCEVLHPRAGLLLEELSDLIGQLTIHRRVPQIEVALGDADFALNFRVLDTPSEADLEALRDFGRSHDAQIHLQPAGPESVFSLWPDDASPLVYELEKFGLTFSFLPGHFTQVNAHVNSAMVDRALDLLQPDESTRTLDLFCGLGNFTLPLATRAGAVVGVEGDRSLVEWAKRNAESNGIGNVEFYAADLATDSSEQPWARRHYDSVLLDPPRSGALEALPLLARLGASRVVYVSCQPGSLARDAGLLVREHGYTLEQAGVIDMFPQTAHVESIALLTRD